MKHYLILYMYQVHIWVLSWAKVGVVLRKVVVYARVSTEHEAQISALENQVQYYDEILKRHPDWILVDRYIDEGITGTSINKRKNFIRMMKEAKTGRFDLIITREVSRFARNIVDTLQQTRLLKTYGVEVWFTEDNIWTLNDEDGELRLSIMATLAQNESKKISQRVKAGQMISFKNGILYGNGNILGYDRVGDQLIVNKEQAETVRRIFQLYLEGNGVRKIRDIMEKEHRLTSSGLTNWQAGNINRVLGNSFYCGRIEYRKQYVPDYLIQKKVNNHGEVERVYIRGTHEPIISEEDFDRAQELKKERSTRKAGKTYGKMPSKSVWGRKVHCKCGHAMNRRVCYISTKGLKSYSYQCYDQLHTGTPEHRLNKGLSIEGVCDNTTFPEWKLKVQADFIFRKLLKNKQAIYDAAIKMLDDLGEVDCSGPTPQERMEANINEIDKLKKKMAILVDLCTDGDVSKEIYRDKKRILEDQIDKLLKENNDLKLEIADYDEDASDCDRKTALEGFIKMKAFSLKRPIPETWIMSFVHSIIYDRGTFHWVINPNVGEPGNAVISELPRLQPGRKSTSRADSSTGSYQCKISIVA